MEGGDDVVSVGQPFVKSLKNEVFFIKRLLFNVQRQFNFRQQHKLHYANCAVKTLINVLQNVKNLNSAQNDVQK